MASGLDWYKREPVAYLGDVQGLSAKEHAVYSVVIDLLYQHGGTISNDPKWIAGWISDMGSAAVRKALASLDANSKISLIITDIEISQKRAKTEAKRKRNVSETRAKSGEKGGKKSAEIRAASKENKDLSEANTVSKIQPDKIREEKSIGGGGDARARSDHDPPNDQDLIKKLPPFPDREMILTAIGVDPVSGLTGNGGQMIGKTSDMIEARRWRDDLNLSEQEIAAVIREVMASKPDGPPASFRYFTGAMERLAAEKAKPPLTVIPGGHHERSHTTGSPRPARSEAGQAVNNLLAAAAGVVSDERRRGGSDEIGDL